MKPKIRLKGFCGEWEKKTLSQILTVSNEQNKNNLFKKEDVFSVSDEYGIVNQIKHLGRSYAGKSLTGYKILRINQIVYTKSPLRQKPYGIIKVNESGVGIVSVLYGIYNVSDEVHPKYIDRYFEPSYRTNNYLLPLINKGAKNTINISDQTAIAGEIILPHDKDEQIAICKYLDSIDSLIQSTTKKIESLKQVKAACLQSMFPQEGEATPRVRFKGFVGEWENKTLVECLTINNERNQNNVYGINDVLSVSDEVGVVNQIKLLGRSYAGKSVANYRVLKTNQIVYTKSPLKSKPYGIVKVNKGAVGIVSVLYAVYDTNENVYPDYIHYYFEPTHRINSYLLPLINKGAKNTMNISDEMTLTGNIWIPSFDEQKKIADFFAQLDSQITLQTQRLKKLKQIKSACLDNMFV